MCWPPQKKILKRLIKNFKYRIHNKKSHAMNVLLPPLLHLLCSGTAAVSYNPCKWFITQKHRRWLLSFGAYRVCLLKFVLLKFSSSEFANQINLHSRSKATSVSECNSSHSVSDMHNMCIAESLNRIYSHRLY